MHQIHRSTAAARARTGTVTHTAGSCCAGLSHVALSTHKAAAYCNIHNLTSLQTAAAHSCIAQCCCSALSFCVEHSCSDTSSIIKRRKRSRSALCGIERCREHISGQAKGGGGYDAAVWWSGQRTDTAYRLTALTKREPGLSGFRKSLSGFRT
jgi:hypothetical protein